MGQHPYSLENRGLSDWAMNRSGARSGSRCSQSCLPIDSSLVSIFVRLGHSRGNRAGESDLAAVSIAAGWTDFGHCRNWRPWLRMCGCPLVLLSFSSPVGGGLQITQLQARNLASVSLPHNARLGEVCSLVLADAVCGVESTEPGAGGRRIAQWMLFCGVQSCSRV